ncbi:MAG TPA: hypothetical protein VHA09_01275 [Nitrososphaera sp.]|nr:hypothetical protein [Nitrososphaera sp.]
MKLLSLKFLILITVVFLSIEMVLTLHIMIENEHLAQAVTQQISSSISAVSYLPFVPAASSA